MAIKIKLGKLDLSFDLKELATYLSRSSIEILPVVLEHILETLDLDDHPRDPFDKIIIAQAKFERMTIISKDENFPKYTQIKLVW